MAPLGVLTILLPLLVKLTEYIGMELVMAKRRMDYARELRERQARLNIMPLSKRIQGSYAAPLHGCRSESVIPDDYLVYFRQSYTLEKHRQAIGDAVDLDSAIKLVLKETDSFGLHYSARLNDTGLAVVRSDVAVDVVECNARGWLIE